MPRVQYHISTKGEGKVLINVILHEWALNNIYLMIKPHPVDRMGTDQLLMAPEIVRYVHHMLQLLSSAISHL